jgi:hypothetical protein
MWRWLRVAVARVFALVVRCRVDALLLYSRVGKNRDTRRESPAGAGAGRTADHLTVLFSQKVLAVRRGNDIYRPVSANVRRYVQLAQSRGGACFCTRGAIQGYAVITLFSRWQKP